MPALQPVIVGSLRGMKIETLDHIALWVGDRDELADFLVDRLGMHVIDRTDKFTLVGADARRGKLTLFAAEPDARPRPSLADRPAGVRPRRGARRAPARPRGRAAGARPRRVRGPAGRPVRAGRLPTTASPTTSTTSRSGSRIPSRRSRSSPSSASTCEDGRLKAGDAYVDLEQGEVEEPERPLLNHLGLRVESADHHIREAEERGLEIADIVDAANTYAVFVWGPDGIKLEYVEHKPTFSLV